MMATTVDETANININSLYCICIILYYSGGVACVGDDGVGRLLSTQTDRRSAVRQEER